MRFKNYRVELLLFLCMWLTYGLTINSHNLEGFGLQQMGVEAIVERGHFYLEGSKVPQLQPLGDVFLYGGHKYAAKQPGQFMTGAIVYSALHLFGLTYGSHYLITAALVTFFTAALATALSVVALFRITRAICQGNASLSWPLGASLLYGLGTTTYAYSGIAHHDAIATAFTLMALYAASYIAHADVGTGRLQAILAAISAGLFLGWTVTTSMLVLWPALAVFLYFLSLGQLRLVLPFLLGGLIGLAPLLFYDYVNFGDPFLLPNLAGNYRDTFFHLDLSNFLIKLRFYAKTLTQFVPVFWLGVMGLCLLPRQFRREQLFATGAIVVLCAYIFNIDTNGTCQYGPRYLMPVMAFSCLGLAGFSYLETGARRAFLSVLVILIGAISIIINGVGAAQGAMYCDLDRYALWPYLVSLRTGPTAKFPLFLWLIVPLSLAVWCLTKAIHSQIASTSPK